jgi:anti-sigma factor RsiW
LSLADPHRELRPEHPGLSEAGTSVRTCRDVIGLLLDYLEEALDPDTSGALERHLQDCRPCRVYLKTYDRSRRLVGDVTRNEMPRELTDRLREFLLRRLRSERA